jgi:2,5-furandicarboxylate decarboxylase 1
MSKDLRTYLKQLHDTYPGQLKAVKTEVSRKWDITAIVEKIRKDRYPEFPALFFPKVSDSRLPVLINLCASYERLGLSIDSTVKNMVPEYAERERAKIPPIEVSSREAPVKEIIWRGDDIDLNKLPIVWHNELDSGYYIDAGVSLLKDPETGKINAGIYRHEVQNPDELGFLSNPSHHGAYIMERMRERGKPLEIAIAIGHHPAFLMAAVSQLVGVGGELEACGGLLREPLEMVHAETVDLMIPARAEIVMEGIIDTDPKAMRTEGPFGEYPRYYTGVGQAPFIKLTAISMRADAIYQTVFGAHIEHTCLGALPRMGSLYRRLRETIPSIAMVNLPISGMGRSHAYISIKKTLDGEPKQAAFAAFAVDPLIKHVFVVDDDVDVFDDVEVIWCMCTRFQADRDLAIIPYALGSRLSPKSYDLERNERAQDRNRKVMETKMILDLTKPAPPIPFPPRCGVPTEVIDRVTLEGIREWAGPETVLGGKD